MSSDSILQKQPLVFSYPLLGLCAGILLASIISAFISQRVIVSSLEARSAQYGQALADLAARQAMDATLNHDLVSLQVILSDIVDNPDVRSASIHDVENNLLVQAGDVRRQGHIMSFTAAIALHNSIAGYVAVSLDMSGDQSVRYQLYWLFGFMAVLLIALTLSALYFGRSWGVPLAMPRRAIPILRSPPRDEARKEAEEETASAARPPAPSFPRVELILHFHNLRELRNQLDHRAFHRVSQRIEEQFRSLLALYQGQLIQLDGAEARLAFADSQGIATSAFQAVCAATLLLTLNARSKPFPLTVSALILQRDSDASILKNLQFNMAELDEYHEIFRNSAAGTLLLDSRLLDADLESKLQQQALDDFADLVEVQGLSEPYEQLMARQLAQLQQS